MFGHLGERFTVVPTPSQKDMAKATGFGSGSAADPAKHMMGVLGAAAASRRYHERLIRAVYSSRSSERRGVDTMLDQQLAAGRRMHAADLAALLCEFPDSAVKLIRSIGLQDAQGTVGVGWAGTRRVGIDFTAVHISPSSEGAEGPAMLWAGKDAAGLLEQAELDQPERVLKPQVVGFDGAITTLELLPAIIASPVSAELLTCPAMDAVMLAKWKLLKPWWAVEVGIFGLVFGLYLSHALVEEETLQARLVAAASLLTLPLFAMEWRQYRAGAAMSGVAGGKLSKRIKYIDIYQLLDLLGLSLVCTTNAVLLLSGRHPTLIAFTVLLLSWKSILFMRINRTMGFLMATLVECMHEIKFFLLVLILAVCAFSLSFNLQMQQVTVDDTAGAPDVAAAADAAGEFSMMSNSSSNSSGGSGNVAVDMSAYGAPGLDGMGRSLWATFLLTILGDFDPDIFFQGGWTTIISFLLITAIVNIIMLNVLIAIVGQAQEAVLAEGDATFAHLFAETLAGLDAIHPRVRRKAFCGDDEVVVALPDAHNRACTWRCAGKERTRRRRSSIKDEHHNEVRYWCAAWLVKWAFGEPRGKPTDDDGGGASARSMPLRDMLATVHVLSASSHPENEGAWEWLGDRLSGSDPATARRQQQARTAQIEQLAAVVSGARDEVTELRRELKQKEKSEEALQEEVREMKDDVREMKAMIGRLLGEPAGELPPSC